MKALLTILIALSLANAQEKSEDYLEKARYKKQYETELKEIEKWHEERFNKPAPKWHPCKECNINDSIENINRNKSYLIRFVRNTNITNITAEEKNNTDEKIKTLYKKRYGTQISEQELSTTNVYFTYESNDSYYPKLSIIRTANGGIIKRNINNSPTGELTTEEWTDFIRALYKHKIKDWKELYNDCKDCNSLKDMINNPNSSQDNTHWFLNIYSIDKDGHMHEFKTKGYNQTYPPNWNEVKKLMQDMEKKANKKAKEITNDFKDTNFLAEVRKAIDKPKGAIYDTDVANITKLKINEKNITSLAGIEHFTALETLYCWKNQLTTLDLSKNKELKHLNCSNNQLTALNISNNPKLKNLYCQHNQLTALDISKNTYLLNNYTKPKDKQQQNNPLTEGYIPGGSNGIGVNLNESQLNCSHNKFPNKSAIKGFKGEWGGSFIFEPQTGSVWFKFEDKRRLYGYKDEKGEVKIEPKFQSAPQVFENIIAVRDTGASRNEYYLTKAGRIVGKDSSYYVEKDWLDCESEGFIRFKDKKTKKSGMFNRDGNVAIPANYVSIDMVNSGLIKAYSKYDKNSVVIIDTLNNVLINNFGYGNEKLDFSSIEKTEKPHPDAIRKSYAAKGGGYYSFIDTEKEFKQWANNYLPVDLTPEKLINASLDSVYSDYWQEEGGVQRLRIRASNAREFITDNFEFLKEDILKALNPKCKTCHVGLKSLETVYLPEKYKGYYCHSDDYKQMIIAPSGKNYYFFFRTDKGYKLTFVRTDGDVKY